MKKSLLLIFIFTFFIANILFAQTTWTGMSDNDWFSLGNWDSGVPTMGINAIIPDVAIDPEISAGDAECLDLIINAGAQLTIRSDGSLTLWNDLTNNGEFIINSSVGSFGSFIDKGTVNGSGNYIVQRYLTDVGGEGYHYVSSPITNAVTGMFVGYWFKEWVETQNQWFDIDPYGANCFQSSEYDVPIELMKGYNARRDINYSCICPPQGQLIEFNTKYDFFNGINTYPVNYPPDGSLNTGLITSILTASNASEPPDPPIYDNWNLFGNPYPSSIDWELVTVPEDMDLTIYYFDPVADNYKFYTQSIGGTGSQYIPPTQGCFVRVSNAVAFSVDNSVRTHLGSDIYYKALADNLVVLKVGYNDNPDSDYYDEAWIHINENATENFDSEYDAYKLFSYNPQVPQLYSMVGDVNYALNSLPSTDHISQIGFSCGTSGEYRITATELSDFEYVVLEDLKSDFQLDLTQDPEYVFSYSTVENSDRFLLHFSPLNIDENKNYTVQIYSYINTIYIYFPTHDNATVNVYSMDGKKLECQQLNQGLNNIDLYAGRGHYLVEVISVKGKECRTLFIK